MRVMLGAVSELVSRPVWRVYVAAHASLCAWRGVGWRGVVWLDRLQLAG